MGVADSPAARAAMAEHHAQHASLIMGPDTSEEAPASASAGAAGQRVVFYRLGRKFVDTEESISSEAADVIYYTLAVGHHTGVIDCFEEALACSKDDYARIVAFLPEGDARYKLEGILRTSEIQVDKTNLPVLGGSVHEAATRLQAQVSEGEGDAAVAMAANWYARFAELLDLMKSDPVVYFMGRLRG